MKAQIVIQVSSMMVPQKRIQKILDLMVSLLEQKRVRHKIKLQRKELILVFVGAEKMKQINFKYRSKNKPTDILSFSSEDPDSLGELVICPEVLLKQSLQHQKTLTEEMSLMILHGILHLLGYDHELNASEDRLMSRLQNTIYEQSQMPKSKTVKTQPKRGTP